MIKNTATCLVMTGFVFWILLISTGYTAESISPATSLLLNNSLPGYPKTLSGQPGKVETITLPEQFINTGEVAITVNGETVPPIEWNEFYRELSIVIPYLEPGVYPLNITLGIRKLPYINLTIQPLQLPKDLTAETVVKNVERSLEKIIEYGMGLMTPDTQLSQENKELLDNLLAIFTENFNQLPQRDKEFIAALFYNGKITELSEITEESVNAKSIKESKRVPNRLLRPCSLDTSLNGCVDEFNLDPFRNATEYECDKYYPDWSKIYNLTLVHKIFSAKSRLLKYYIKPISSSASAFYSCNYRIIEGVLKKSFTAITAIGLVTDLVNATVESGPVQLIDIVARVNNPSLYAYDETLYSATATFTPLRSSSTSGVLFSLAGALNIVVRQELEKLGIDCVFDVADLVVNWASVSLSTAIEDSEYNIDPRVDLDSIRTVEMRPNIIQVDTGSQLLEVDRCKCGNFPTTMYQGVELIANKSPASISKDIETAMVTFSYPDLYGKPIKSVRGVSVRNRLPLIEHISRVVDSSKLNVTQTIDLLFRDQECDQIKDYEITGTAKFGTMVLDKAQGQVNYTLTDSNPINDEVFGYRVFDGAEWSQTAELRIATTPLSATPCADLNLPGPEVVSSGGHEWTRCAVSANWFEASGTYHKNYNPEIIDVCGDLVVNGYSNWRLPTTEEVLDIINCPTAITVEDNARCLSNTDLLSLLDDQFYCSGHPNEWYCYIWTNNIDRYVVPANNYSGFATGDPYDALSVYGYGVVNALWVLRTEKVFCIRD